MLLYVKYTIISTVTQWLETSFLSHLMSNISFKMKHIIILKQCCVCQKWRICKSRGIKNFCYVIRYNHQTAIQQK
jgi:hypothetical protein